MSKQIANRSTSQKGSQPNLLFKIGPPPDSTKPLILKPKIEYDLNSKQLNESSTVKEIKTKPIQRSATSKSPTPIKQAPRSTVSPDISMISQKSSTKARFFKEEETPVSKKLTKDSRSNSKEAPRLLSNKQGLDVKTHMDSKNSLSTRDESVDKVPKKLKEKPKEVLFEYSEEESATKKVRSKSPVKENLDPARRTTNYINPKTSVTPKDEPNRDRSANKQSVANTRPSKYFETEENDNYAVKKNDNVVSGEDIQKKLQILRRAKGMKKTDSKSELIIDHALRNKISDELILGSSNKTPKSFGIKSAISPTQKVKKTISQTEQSLKALISSSTISKDSQIKTHIRRESSPTNKSELSFAMDKSRTSTAKKLNLRSTNLLTEEKIIPEVPAEKKSITPTVSKSSSKILTKKDFRDSSVDYSMVSPRQTEKAKAKNTDTRQSLNRSPILGQSQNMSQSHTSLRFKKELVEQPSDKQNGLFQTSAKKEEAAMKSRTSTAKKLKRTVEEEPCDKTTIQPSKNSDFFFQMNFFKPIDDTKLDEFIQNVNDTKSKTNTETDNSVLVSPRLDQRSSFQQNKVSSKLPSTSLTPRDFNDRSKLERENPLKEKAAKIEKERVEKEKAEKDKVEKIKSETKPEKVEKEKSDKDDKEKTDKEKPEKEKKDREIGDREKIDRERLEKSRIERSDKSPEATRLNMRLSKDFTNVAKLPKSKSPSHRIESMPVKQGLGSRDNSSMKDLTGKSEMVTTETYSRLDQLLQELRANIDKSQILNDEDEGAEKGLFSSDASESNSTSYSVNKSFAKNLIAFGNL